MLFIVSLVSKQTHNNMYAQFKFDCLIFKENLNSVYISVGGNVAG